jgi:hypothetical protein
MFSPSRLALVLLALLAAGVGSVAAASPAGPHLGAATRMISSVLELGAAATGAALAVLGKGAGALSALVWSALGGHPAFAPPLLLGFLAGIGAACMVVALLVVMAFTRSRAGTRLP